MIGSCLGFYTLPERLSGSVFRHNTGGKIYFSPFAFGEKMCFSLAVSRECLVRPWWCNPAKKRDPKYQRLKNEAVWAEGT